MWFYRRVLGIIVTFYGHQTAVHLQIFEKRLRKHPIDIKLKTGTENRKPKGI